MMVREYNKHDATPQTENAQSIILVDRLFAWPARVLLWGAVVGGPWEIKDVVP